MPTLPPLPPMVSTTNLDTDYPMDSTTEASGAMETQPLSEVPEVYVCDCSHGWAKTFKKILYEEYRFFGKTVFVKTIFTKQVFVKMRCPPPSLRQLFRKSFWRFLGKSLKNLQNGVLKNLYCEFETSPWFSSKNKSQNKSDFKGTKGGWCIEVLI